VDLVDKDFEFETLARLGVSELGSVAEGTIAGFSLRAAVIFQRIVAIVAASGLDHSVLRLMAAMVNRILPPTRSESSRALLAHRFS
jgi:hypothetical protein